MLREIKLFLCAEKYKPTSWKTINACAVYINASVKAKNFGEKRRFFGSASVFFEQFLGDFNRGSLYFGEFNGSVDF